MKMPYSNATAILLLHSSCIEDKEEEEDKESLTSHMAYNNEANPTLSSLPIICDILMIPEIPRFHSNGTSLSNRQQAIKLYGNEFNPCGISNILLLEEFPWRREKILLSLTSCSVEGENFVHLVDPTPSTFDFFFQEVEDQRKPMAELYLEFTLTTANTQYQEKIDDSMNASTILRTAKPAEVPAKTTPSSVDSTPDLPSPECLDPQHCYRFYTDMCINPWQEHSRQQSQEQQQALKQLQLMMERDTNDLDQIIFVVVIVGVVLFGLLMWSGWQLYASFRRKIFSPEGTLSRMSLEPVSLNPILERAREHRKNGLDTTADFLKPNPTPERSEVPYSPECQQKSTNMPDNSDLSPCSQLAQKWSEKKTVRRSNRKKREMMKPFSNSARADHHCCHESRASKRDLEVPFRANDAILGPPSLVSTAKGNNFQAQLTARKNLLRDPLEVKTESRSKPDVDLPSLAEIPMVNSQYEQNQSVDASGSTVSIPIVPDLCFTPGSENQSFVDDYW